VPSSASVNPLRAMQNCTGALQFSELALSDSEEIELRKQAFRRLQLGLGAGSERILGWSHGGLGLLAFGQGGSKIDKLEYVPLMLVTKQRSSLSELWLLLEVA